MSKWLAREAVLIGFVTLVFGKLSASTFIPVKLEDQAELSTASVLGKFESKKSYACGDQICTEIKMLVDYSVGLGNEKKYFTFHVPGGSLNGVTEFVHGAPNFSHGDEFAVFVHKASKEKFWLYNLALGKYSIKEEEGIKYLVNDVFPFNPEMGKFTVDDFKNQVVSVKKIPWVNHLEASVSESKPQIERSIASVKEEEDPSSTMNYMGLIFILMTLIVVTKYATRKKFKGK